MAYFVQGLAYGLVAVGWLMSFMGGIMVLISFLAFVSWLMGKFGGDHDGKTE